jgi:hypothetical protein
LPTTGAAADGHKIAPICYLDIAAPAANIRADANAALDHPETMPHE